MKLLFLFLPLSAYAGFGDLSEGEFYQNRDRRPPEHKQRRQRGPRPQRIRKVRNDNDANLKKLLEQDQKIFGLLNASSKQLHIKRSEEKIPALARVRGTLLNSVVALNTAPSTFIVRIEEGEDIKGAELKCLGQNFQRRVISKCALMVAEGQEYPINVEIWDLDGAQGMIADYTYSGEEKAFLSSSLASFLEGSLEAAKGQIITPLGAMAEKNARNQILSGLGNIAQNTQEKINQSGDDKLSIAYINAGKPVLAFFHQSLTLNKEAIK